MDNNEVEKSKAFMNIHLIGYKPDSVVYRTIIKKPAGNISILSFDIGEGLAQNVSPFDTLDQIIEGRAEIIIDGSSNLLETGQSIIIPAHTSNTVRANERFKMISTVIKSGYE